MSLKTSVFILIFFTFSFFSDKAFPSNLQAQKNRITHWNIYDLLNSKTLFRTSGNPNPIDCKYGKALGFNGQNDGVFLEEMPLLGMDEFTIEVLFYPESGGNFEQRFFHTGEIRGDRVLLEIRTDTSSWYFDAFIQSGNQKMTLIDPKFLHPLNQWYHLAYVVNKGKLCTYINGKKELEGAITFSPIQTGKTSIGVRLNEQSWFKGAISQIRISPKALKSNEFLNL